MSSARPDPNAGPPPFTPEQFGKYALVDRIATGGMAEIFRAKSFAQGGFEHELVIKRILPHVGANDEFIEMFQDEAKVSVALQHPNIVRVFDFGRVVAGNQSHWYIVMECVDGKDVRNLLRKLARVQRFLPVEFAAFVTLEACKGLHYAHVKADPKGVPYHIVHRDISPSNLLLSYDGEVKVADFGIAKAKSNAYRTKDGVLKGKFEYMSPEQAQGVPFDARSDLFSLGIVLWEMLSGRRLFRTESEQATLAKVREAQVEPIEVVKPDVPERLAQICARALTRDPAERYTTAQEFEADLREFLFPETSDTLRARFRAYVRDLFADEIAGEHARRDAADAGVTAVRERILAEWDAPPEGTLGNTRPGASGAGAGGVAILGALGVTVMGLLLVGAAVLLLGVLTLPAVWIDDEVAVTTGSLDVVVLPETARITVDGVLHPGTMFAVDGLEPGAHLVRIEADGFVPADITVQIQAGRATKLAKSLDAVALPAPLPAPPAVEFRSTPPGAAVFVAGAPACAPTPCTWTGAALGETYTAELRLGAETVKVTVRDVIAGPQRVVAAFPSAAAPVPEPEAAPATFGVVLAGVMWADVYVDGVKLAKGAPFQKVPIAPGRHEIRVENAAAGYSKTETRTFVAGENTTLRFSR